MHAGTHQNGWFNNVVDKIMPLYCLEELNEKFVK
jgi:hypothetical protein